ncbi:hypothetical protein NQ317_016442 [Molorchus minor]|uniref:RNA-directed DNA polymerase n=1 Tax=Molorchus minor TaxID=1323400 RepID=A0ABQ9ISH7_9CUCU|nr:hypothetical protein NQ317_016442 [Molorchus minor]
MSRKLQVNRLDKDELSYELTVRGIATGTCEEMRRRLSQALQLEKSGDSLKYPEYPYTFEEDHEVVNKKLQDLTKMLDGFSQGRGSNEALKIRTKFNHVLGRLDNLVCDTVEKQKTKSEVLAATLTLMDTFDNKVCEYEKRKGTNVPPSLLYMEEQTEPSTFREDIGRASTSSSLDGVQPAGAARGNQLPFFEQVEELRVARSVSKETLLNSGIDLFSDRAYQFYKDCRGRVTSWNELVNEFRQEYLSASYDDELFEELQRRTQHSSESIGVYLAIMSSYFGRLRCAISEDTKLKIILRNLHPYYLERLSEPMPSTLAELRSSCRSMEARRDMMKNYVEPPTRRSNALEKDLAYIDISEDLSAIETSSQEARDQVKTNVIICYRCSQQGHKANECNSKKITWKRKSTLLDGRSKCVESRYSTNIQPVLDFIIDHAENDERPYLRVSVMGKSLLGLLDSGASSTIIGGKGWSLVKDLGLVLNNRRKIKCTVANGQQVESAGECEIPFCVRDKVKLIKVLVVPEVPHTLILGTNFWRNMGIVPDLRHNEWYFSDQPICLDVVDHIRTEGRLFKYVKPKYTDLSDGSDCWKQVVPKELRSKVISETHDPPLAGHMGIYKTFNRVAEKYYWPKMRYDVANYVRHCSTCAAYKPDLGGPKGLMTVPPRASFPWEIISSDLMGPFPRSNRGHQYILVVSDLFSKFSLVFPLRSSSADMVAKRIEEEVFLMFGVPRLLICDNGPQRPEVEGNDENRPEKDRQEGFNKLFLDVRKRRRNEQFLVDQPVWRRNFALSNAANFFTSKLAPKFVGPFYISKCLSPWTYELRDKNGISKGVWNAKDLKSASACENFTQYTKLIE